MRLRIAFFFVIALACSASAEEMTLHRDSELKFEIQYPSGWKVETDRAEDGALRGISLLSADNGATCSIYANELSGTHLAIVKAGSWLAGQTPSDAIFEGWDEGDWKDVMNFMDDAKILSHREVRMKDGKRAAHAEITGTYDSDGTKVAMHIMAVTAYAREKMFVQQCIASALGDPEPVWQRHLKTFEAITNSFDVQQ